MSLTNLFGSPPDYSKLAMPASEANTFKIRTNIEVPSAIFDVPHMSVTIDLNEVVAIKGVVQNDNYTRHTSQFEVVLARSPHQMTMILGIDARGLKRTSESEAMHAKVCEAYEALKKEWAAFKALQMSLQVLPKTL